MPGSDPAPDDVGLGPLSDDEWWRSGVVYQIYPRSFADTDGDGVGDLPGIIDHLDHLAGGPDSLGVDAIWLSPIYPSPGHDLGYDVSDHSTVDPLFGTMADLDRLIQECHRRQVRVMLDLVMNHTSDQHPWFAESRLARSGPFADHYLWRDPSGRADDGRPLPPNNWLSWFGGSAWAWEPRREQFYLHTFLPEQPDVNWRSPALRAEMWSMVRGWLDRGVDGFRLDVFNTFVKAEDMPSNPEVTAEPGSPPWFTQEHRHDKDQPELHDVLAEFRAIVDDRPGTATVGELFTNPVEDAVAYWAPRHLVFDWVLILTEWTAPSFRSAIAAREAAWGERWPSTVLSNHDQSRHVSRFLRTLGRDDEQTADAVAKAAATIELTLRGTPFLYYGEEIGARDITVPRELARDRAALRMADWWNRDGCRAPMTWAGDEKAGFTSGTPWLPIPPDAASRNVERQQTAEGSVLAHYRRLLGLRRASAALRVGDLTLADVGDPDVLAYLRRAGDDTALVVVRFGLRGGEVDLPAGGGPWKVALSSHEQASPTVGSRVTIRPLEAIILRS
jgi:alpha-glucosidase